MSKNYIELIAKNVSLFDYECAYNSVVYGLYDAHLKASKQISIPIAFCIEKQYYNSFVAKLKALNSNAEVYENKPRKSPGHRHPREA
jgi:hypothetical protein